MTEDFHSRCDNKGPTISLFKTWRDDCIGGFTKAQWGTDSTPAADDKAMLFNLTDGLHLPTKRTGREIFRSNSKGPTFGSGNGFSLTVFPPFNGENKCCSNVSEGTYNIENDEHFKTELTNNYGSDFTIKDLECWEVTYLD